MSEDPWDWDVDRVVRELCTNNRSWVSKYPLEAMPDLKKLEDNLRANEVDGEILLGTIDQTHMRESLDIKSIKHQGVLNHAISRIRMLSSQYRSNKDSTFQPLSTDRKRPASEQSYSGETKKARIDPASHGQSPTGKATSPGPQGVLTSREGTVEEASLDDLPKPGKEPKRGTLVFVGPIDPNRQRDTITPPPSSKNQGTHTSSKDATIQDTAVPVPGAPSTGEVVRKSASPLNIPEDRTEQPRDSVESQGLSSPIDEDQDEANVPNPEAIQDHVSPRKDGKRLKTIKISTKAGPKYSREMLARGYLGNRRMPVDDIFYGDSVVKPKDFSEGRQTGFSFSGLNISSGRRLYVHHLVKKSLSKLSRTPHRFSRNGKNYFAMFPYNPKILPRFQEQSFTLFTEGEISRKEVVSKWPELGIEATGNPLLDFSEFSQDYDSLLKRWSAPGVEDRTLPLFNDSGSEGEYDDDTWREMEDEAKEKGKTLQRVKLITKKKPLSKEEVASIIKDAEQDLEEVWTQRKLPKLEPKGWKTYRKYRNLEPRAFKKYKKQLRNRIEHLNIRISKIRQELSSEIYVGPNQLFRHARASLEITAYDKFTTNWKLNLLGRPNPPPKPAPVAAKARKIKPAVDDLATDEEDISSASEVDDLDGFITDGSEEHGSGLNADDLRDEDDESSDMSDATTESNHIPLHKNTNIKLEGLPIRSATPQPKSGMVDLTMTSDSGVDEGSSHKKPKKGSRDTIDLITPKKLNPSGSVITRPNRQDQPIIVSDSDSPAKSVQLSPLRKKQREIVKQVLMTYSTDLLSSIHSKCTEGDVDSVWLSMLDVCHNMAFGGDQQNSMARAEFKALQSLVHLLKCYTDSKIVPPFASQDSNSQGRRTEMTMPLIQEVESSKNSFRDLFQELPSIVNDILKERNGDGSNSDEVVRGKGSKKTSADMDDSDDAPLSRQRNRTSSSEDRLRSSSSDYEVPLKSSSAKKAKFIENKDARALRDSNKNRIAEAEKRKKRLVKQLALQGTSATDASHIIINQGKTEDQGFIYVEKSIGQRIKTHQIDGVRFMWNQIVGDAENLQGCLLAHTMGLGKTMQVITLLVAIAEASKSPDPSIRNQIPPKLRSSRYMVLCPTGLVDNWQDELLIWAPENVFGPPFKVTSQMRMNDRVEEMREWYENGGVLIMGYDMFRVIMNNNNMFTDETYVEVKEYLLKGPSIIVADEAHVLKNPSSAINKWASGFASNSRIALTGSPLNNHVEEYYTMVDWVAPNYLGPLAEFRQKYKIPIEAGLWVDSSSVEKRLSRRRLKVLQSELELKVNRANMNTLKNDLPPKKEFVLGVVLTNLQKEAYLIYVRSMKSGRAMDYFLTAKGRIAQGRLWSWLSLLSLLCNHPLLFKDRLLKILHENRDDDPLLGSTDDEDARENESQLGTMVGEAMAGGAKHAMLQLFDSTEDVTSPEHSNKLLIFAKILDESKKVGDKVLVFTQSIPTLKILEHFCKGTNRRYLLLDGDTAVPKRQAMTKSFNTEETSDIFLISTKAGGLGLNLYAANRVIIFDFKYNPTAEEQAVGRAYRIGQTKPVFVYRFVLAGTFEEKIQNKAVYKTQLAAKVVDKENPVAWAKKNAAEYLEEPEDKEQQNLSEFWGEDNVLDSILRDPQLHPQIRSILKTDTFAEEDNDNAFTAEDQAEIQESLLENKYRRQGSEAYEKFCQERQAAQIKKAQEEMQAAQFTKYCEEKVAAREKSIHEQEKALYRQSTSKYAQGARATPVPNPTPIPPPSEQSNSTRAQSNSATPVTNSTPIPPPSKQSNSTRAQSNSATPVTNSTPIPPPSKQSNSTRAQSNSATPVTNSTVIPPPLQQTSGPLNEAPTANVAREPIGDLLGNATNLPENFYTDPSVAPVLGGFTRRFESGPVRSTPVQPVTREKEGQSSKVPKKTSIFSGIAPPNNLNVPPTDSPTKSTPSRPEVTPKPLFKPNSKVSKVSEVGSIFTPKDKKVVGQQRSKTASAAAAKRAAPDVDGAAETEESSSGSIPTKLSRRLPNWAKKSIRETNSPKARERRSISRAFSNTPSSARK